MNLNPCSCGLGKPMRRIFHGVASGGVRLYSIHCSMSKARINKKCLRKTTQFETVAEANTAWNAMNPEV